MTKGRKGNSDTGNRPDADPASVASLKKRERRRRREVGRRARRARLAAQGAPRPGGTRGNRPLGGIWQPELLPPPSSADHILFALRRASAADELAQAPKGALVQLYLFEKLDPSRLVRPAADERRAVLVSCLQTLQSQGVGAEEANRRATEALKTAAQAASDIILTWNHLRGTHDVRPPVAFYEALMRTANGTCVHSVFRNWASNDLRVALATPGANLEPPGAPVTRRLALVGWEILPQGWWRIRSVVSSLQTAGVVGARLDLERLEFLERLQPTDWYHSPHTLKQKYVIATFPTVAVAECPEEGNALYYIRKKDGDWRAIFQLSKLEARKLGAKRIIHEGDWRSRVRAVLATASKREG